MTGLAALVHEIEGAVASRNPARRADALSKVADLFAERAPRIDAAQEAVFDNLILILAQDLEAVVRAQLAERVADMRRAPRRVLGALARDEGRVAAPVLERSPALSEGDLVDIAMTRGQEHLRALSRRKVLTAPVTDVIVERGDEGVLRCVTGNRGARFSPGGFSALVRRAGPDEALLSTLGVREDLPQEHFARLMTIARDRARASLEEEFGGDLPGSVDGVIDEVAAALEDEARGAPALSRYEASFDYLRERARTRPVEEAEIGRWLARNQTEEAVAGLAVVNAMPVALVVRAYFSTGFHPLLFVVRAAGYGWPTFKLLLASRWRSQIPTEVMSAAFAAFDLLSPATAGRVVRFAALRRRTAAL
jgi:uncharacterized protein (DUF2336 family)